MAKFSIKIELELDADAKELREELGIEPEDDMEEAVKGAFEDLDCPIQVGEFTVSSVTVRKTK